MKRQRRLLLVIAPVAALPLVPALTSAAPDVTSASGCEVPPATVPVDVTTQAPLEESTVPTPVDQPTPTSEVVTSTSDVELSAPTTEAVAESSVVEPESFTAFRSASRPSTDGHRVSADPAPPPREVYRFTIPKLNIAFTPFKDVGQGPCGITWELESNGTVQGRNRWVLTVNAVPPDRTCTAEVIVVDSKGVRRSVQNLTIKRLKTDPPGPETTHMIEFTHPVNNLDGGTVEVKLACAPPARSPRP